jgi:CHASE3 domain sensor protein
MDSYAETKQKYYDAMREAQQASPDKQPELIQHLLDLNSELAKQVREFIASEPDHNIEPELKKIQKEFLKVKESTDRKKTIDMILNEDKHKIQNMKWQFNLLLFFLGLSIITIVYMIIRLGAQKIVSTVTPTLYTATT